MRIEKKLSEVLSEAFTNAMENKHQFFTPEHILLSILNSEKGKEIIENCGVKVDPIIENLKNFIKDFEISKMPPVETVAVQKINEKALNHAINASKTIMTLSDFLVAIFDLKDSHASYFLKKEGIERIDLLNIVSRKDNDEDDSINDMAGYTTSFIIGGINSNANIDSLGPEIKLYMNDSNFRSEVGRIGITDANPQLLVKLFDSSGINITGIGIGHDLMAIIDNDFSHLVSLNEFYQYEINDYTRGSALYPLYNLEPGEHLIKVVAWDVYNNSSDKEIAFNVIEGNNMVLNNVSNYPNPFANYTNFVFEHNWSGETMDIEVSIFSLSGQIVNILKTRDISSGYRTAPVQWNGTDSKGNRVGSGIYLYKVQASTKSGRHAEGHGKLVIVRSK